MKIGIIGAGRVVEEFHLPAVSCLENTTISWLCDLDATRAQTLAKRFGIARSFSALHDVTDVDIALIATPVGTRGPIIQELSQRKFHILCEKPFARSAAEYEEHLKVAEEANLEIGVGLMRRTFASTLLLKNTIESGIFGAPLEIFAAEGARQTQTRRDSTWYQLNQQAAGGGVLIETGSHLLDQVAFSLSAKIGSLIDYQETAFDGIDVDVSIKTLLTPSVGSPVPTSFRLSRINDLPNGIWVKFEHCTLCASTGPEQFIAVYDRNHKLTTKLMANAGASNLAEAFYNEWLEFIKQCKSRKTSLVSAHSALLATQLIDSCYASRNIGAANE